MYMEEIKKMCGELSLPDTLIDTLVESGISPEKLKERIDRIRYYRESYPQLDLELSRFITGDTIAEYVASYVMSIYTAGAGGCVGDCATCTRKTCIGSKSR